MERKIDPRKSWVDDETENISPHSQKGRNSVHNTGFILPGVLISVHKTGLGVFSVSTKWVGVKFYVHIYGYIISPLSGFRVFGVNPKNSNPDFTGERHIFHYTFLFDAYYQDSKEARRAIFEYIEGWYNRKRIHSAIGYMTPQQKEDEELKKAA